MKIKTNRRRIFDRLHRLVGWWIDVRSVRECKSILRASGSEDYCIRRDAFLLYVETQANPARKEAGLAEIGESEAKACFRIIEDFRQRWNNPAHPRREETLETA